MLFRSKDVMIPAVLSLEPEDLHLVRAAQGWLELGNPAEAENELSGLHRDRGRHPDVLDVRWHIAGARLDWAAARDLGVRHVETAPGDARGWINRSNALHFLTQYLEAYRLLQPAAALFPKNDVIPYNMACHLARLGQLEEAWRWLQESVSRSDPKTIRRRALADADLEPLRKRILEELPGG